LGLWNCFAERKTSNIINNSEHDVHTRWTGHDGFSAMGRRSLTAGRRLSPLNQHRASADNVQHLIHRYNNIVFAVIIVDRTTIMVNQLEGQLVQSAEWRGEGGGGLDKRLAERAKCIE
jgi:hypothetical protein